MQKNLAKENLIIYISISLIFASVYLLMSKELVKANSPSNLKFEFVNTKNISVAKVAYKNGVNPKEKVSGVEKTEPKPIAPESKPESKPEPKPEPKPPVVDQINNTPKVKWSLPTRTGRITSTENYSHVALDITSPRGVYETIYPVADGVVSGIYYDSAGAKIVTVHHIIDGVNYTSQYVHLSSYANGLYVGKPVTVNDPLGQMGRTGIATGVHLHLTVADCTLFDPNDYNCRDLNSFFRYIRTRYNQGFKGLRDLTYVPNNW